MTPWAFVLAVPDLSKSSNYFRDVLGFRVLWEDAPDWRLVERDSVRVMLGLCPDDIPASQLGSHSWFGYIEVDDIDRFHAEIVACGAACTVPADRSYGTREIVVTTVDGHRIVFAEQNLSK